MKKVRTLTVAFAAVAGLVGFTATSAMAENIYSVDGSGTTGGTPTKPKAAKLNATFSTTSSLGSDIQPKPVINFVITIEGGRLNSKALKALTACKPTDKQDSVQSSKQCSKKSIVGSGVLDTVVGVPEEKIKPALACKLPFNIYNIGKGKIAMFIDAKPPTCPVVKQEWLPLATKQVGRSVVSTIAVPESLQLIISPNQYATVLKTDFGFKPVMVGVKVGKKTVKQSTTESIGCTDKKRTVTVQFTDLSGAKFTAKKDVAC